jgi:hypothetical protein
LLRSGACKDICIGYCGPGTDVDKDSEWKLRKQKGTPPPPTPTKNQKVNVFKGYIFSLEQCCGSEFFHPVSRGKTIPDPGSASNNLIIFNPKNCF